MHKLYLRKVFIASHFTFILYVDDSYNKHRILTTTSLTANLQNFEWAMVENGYFAIPMYSPWQNDVL